MSNRVGLLVALVALSVACGGKVVFVEDDDGSGASGAGGAGPGPGPGPGPSTNATTNSMTTGPGTLCEQFCSLYGACVEDDCASLCDGLFTGQCDAEATALLSCMVSEFNGDCGSLQETCLDESQVFADCQNGGSCFTQSCDFGPDGCFCTGFCNESQLDQQCFTLTDGGPPPPGGAPPQSCDCYLDGNFIGSCSPLSPECSIEAGCCSQLVGGIK